MVQLNGNWYHVDVTFDDPEIRWNESTTGATNGFVRNDCFLRTDEELLAVQKANGHPGKWETCGLTATLAIYENIPRDWNTQAYVYSEHCWYSTGRPALVDTIGSIVKSDFYGNNGVTIKSGLNLYGIQSNGYYPFYGMGSQIHC